MKEYIHLEKHDFTILGKNTSINGPTEFEGVTHLCGKIKGKIKMNDRSLLTIETFGVVEGHIECHDMNVYGTVKGEILSTGKITVYPSGRIIGNLVAKNIVIHPGARVDIEGHTDDRLHPSNE